LRLRPWSDRAGPSAVCNQVDAFVEHRDVVVRDAVAEGTDVAVVGIAIDARVDPGVSGLHPPCAVNAQNAGGMLRRSAADDLIDVRSLDELGQASTLGRLRLRTTCNATRVTTARGSNKDGRYGQARSGELQRSPPCHEQAPDWPPEWLQVPSAHSTIEPLGLPQSPMHEWVLQKSPLVSGPAE